MDGIILTKSRHLHPFATLLKANGFNVQRLLKKARLPGNCLENLNALVPSENVGRFRELAAKITGNAKISLDASRHLDFETMGSFGQTLLKEPTLGGLLHKFRELAAAESSNVCFQLYPRDDGGLWFGHRLRCRTESDTWHTSLYALSWMLQLVRLADPVWSPAEILINENASKSHQDAIDELAAKANFQQKSTGFVVPQSMMALPLRRINQHSKVEDADVWATAPCSTYADSLKQVIRSYSSKDWLTIDQASEVIGTSARTLQRRLCTEQKSYSALIQETRADLAQDLLVTTDLSIAQIATELGYHNQGNFTRAFYQWAKVSPSAFRKTRANVSLV